MSVFSELKRRNVIRVGAAYVVTAWLVVQVVETLFPVYGLPDEAVRIVVNVLAIGLVPALVLAWVFEWTPEGVKRDAGASIDAPVSDSAARRLDRVILVVLAMALGYFALDKFVLDPARDVEIAQSAREEGRSEAIIDRYGDTSIAVLAFADMSADQDQAYLGDGLAEEILNLLAKIPELRVISRSSSFTYKDRNVAIPTIAEQLDVAHVLEGSVRKSGDRIRVTTQLIEARSDTHLWSETYDRVLDDIFAIQDELARTVVEQLHLTLLGELPQAQRVDTDAYILFLQARNLLTVGGDPEQAASLLETVVEMEPEFADAWAELSGAYSRFAPSMSRTDHSDDPVWSKMLAARERVRELDPDHPWVLTTTGWETIEEEGDYAAAAALFERAIEQHPENERVMTMGSAFARMIGEYELSAVLAKRAMTLNPLCSYCTYNYARRLMTLGRLDAAENVLQRYRRVVGEGSGGEISLGVIRLLAGDVEGAAAAFEERSDEAGRQYGALLIRLYQGERGNAILDDIEALAELDSYLNPIAPTELYAMAGQKDEAFHWLFSGTESTANWQFASRAQSPFLDSLHDDPRWREFLELADLPPERVAGIQFDPVLAFSAKLEP